MLVSILQRCMCQRRVKSLCMLVLPLALLFASVIGTPAASVAQSNSGPWFPPVNVSRSGASSQPLLAGAPDGTLHMLWWDAVAGEQHTQTDVNGAWITPTIVAPILGERVETRDQRTGKATVTIAPPRDPSAVVGPDNTLHVLWYDNKAVLHSMSLTRTIWSAEAVVADVAATMNVYVDQASVLHVSYVRPTNSPQAPAGVYYRAKVRGIWTAPVLIYPSLYFRTASIENLGVSVVADGAGTVLVTWRDPRTDTGLVARSADGGATWEPPQSVTGTESGVTLQPTVARSPNTEFFLMWRDPVVGGCGFRQRRSNDGGQTWTAVLELSLDISPCPERWSLAAGADNRLWMLGGPRISSTGQVSSQGGCALAAWDNLGWSDLVAVRLNYYDATAQKSVELGCSNVTLAGEHIGVVGSDAKGDLWAAYNQASLNTLLPGMKPAWRVPEMISMDNSVSGLQDLPTLTADSKGWLYALWSQPDDGATSRDALYTAVWNGTSWSRALAVLRTPDNMVDGVANAGLESQWAGQAKQPSLVNDGHGKLHAVWSGGANAGVLYSWAYERDVTSAQGWAQPVQLPAPSTVNGWPEIVADQRDGSLYVIYAVPYNEQRGIYLTRSLDGGATWLSPTAVFDAQAAGWVGADYSRLALDVNRNILHAVWLQLQVPVQLGTDTETNTALFYARSLDGGQSWEKPEKVAEGAIRWPRVVVPGPDQVYVAWNQINTQNLISSAPMMMWGQFSPDAGERWTRPERVRGFDNLSSPAGLVSDGAGHLYLTALGQQDAERAEGTLFFAPWDGQSWGDIEPFGLGRPTALGDSVVPAASAGTGKLGILLRLSTKGQDSTAKYDLIATDRTITATTLLPPPAFTPEPTSIATPEPTPIPIVTAQPTTGQTATTHVEQASPPQQGPGVIVISGTLAALIVVGTFVAKAMQGNKR